ncbi:hypothetical protein MARU1_002628 [Malassezia arunalokei]|uniref:FHA domain-containing protein n=1 Tax=Malassezia arunalokei TaxID=1514897 RepID=A0AAJ5Z0R9_9BASI|nr:hypothetical protein MARU1_002628 [Malassezia arunalokei]
MGDVQPRGSLQLLSDSGDIEVARFQIKKETTTLGRALTNDVRLLLEDVSRKHCKIQFDSENRAVLHVMGSGGVWHNDVHVRPSANDTQIKLNDGDKLQISKHTLTFSYVTAAPASPRKRKPQMAAPESPATPRRQSARIKARASMPCFRTAWTPERAMRPIPLTQQTAPTEPAQSNSNVVAVEQPKTPQAPTMILADLNVWQRTSLETNVPETHKDVHPGPESDLQNDTAMVNETANTSQRGDCPERDQTEPEATDPQVSESGPVDLKFMDPNPLEPEPEATGSEASIQQVSESGPIDLKSTDPNSVEPEPVDPKPADPVAIQSNLFELAQVKQEPLDPHHVDPESTESHPNSPGPIESHPADPQPIKLNANDAQSIHIDSTEFEAAEPERLGFDHAELEPKLDQHLESQPIVPGEAQGFYEALDDHVSQADTKESSAEEKGNEPHDTSDLTLCLDELEEQEVVDANRLLSAAMPTTPRFPPTTPLRWSPAKSRKVSLRTATLLKRSAQLPIVPLVDMEPQCAQTPPPSVNSRIPTSTDSKDMELSAMSSDEEDEEEVDSSLELQCASSPLPQRPLHSFMTPQTKRQEKPMIRRMSCSEMDQPTLRRQPSWQWLKNLFSPSKKAAQESTKEPVPLGSEHASSEVPEQDEQESFFDASGDMDMTSVHHVTTPKANEKNLAPTPDMHVLKHVFAEPKQAVSAEATMHHFRHMMSEPKQTSAMDLSMSSAWTAMEEQVRDVPQEASVPAQTLQVLTPETDQLTKHRATRTVPKKEPYVPVRRQLPPRNAVKMSRIGSLSTSTTRTASEQQAAQTACAVPPDTRLRRSGMASSLPVARDGTTTRTRATKESITNDREDATLNKRVTRGASKARKI